MRPRLLALKSAVPDFILNQTDVARRACELFKESRDITRLLPVFENTGIDSRYSCVPIEWYAQPHGWMDRTALYVENAVDLLEKTTRALLDEAGLQTRSWCHPPPASPPPASTR
jgi:alkylresorcinol/alkylpyrone synthase